MSRGDWNRFEQEFERAQVSCSKCPWKGTTSLSMCYRRHAHNNSMPAMFQEDLVQ